MRSLIPVRAKNLIPACKNIGVTHITNGCYRLHPVEWNIGESAAAIASTALNKDVPIQSLSENSDTVAEVQRLLESQGVELRWPALKAI
jgi:hypothetical protein